MNEEKKRLQSVCFTGHRPGKLGVSESEVKERLRKAILQAVADGFTTFISGMAQGVDMWAAEIVLEIRKSNPDIRLFCTSPYEGFERLWDKSERERYYKIMEESDFSKYICEHYSRSCFQIRNVYMVDRSARVIAAYNGHSGGTRNTVVYARKKGITIVNVLEQE